MRLSTHILTGSCLYSLISTFQGWQVDIGTLTASAVVSIVPDIDSPRSNAGFALPLVRLCQRFGLAIEHEGFFHSFFFIVVTAVIGFPLVFLNLADYYVAILIAIFSHQLFDSMSSKEGIMWFAPVSTDRFFFSPNPMLRIKNERGEKIFLAIVFSTNIFFSSINIIGAERIINNIYSDTTAAIDIFNQDCKSWWLTANVDGIDNITKEDFSGREFDVLGHTARDAKTYYLEIIIRDSEGVYSVADNYDAIFRSSKIRLHRARPIKILCQEIDLTGKTIDQLSRYIATDKEYLIFGKLNLEENILPLPVDLTRFSTVRIANNQIDLQFARVEDIEKAVTEPILVDGNIIVKYFLDLDDLFIVKEHPEKEVVMKFYVKDNYEIVLKEPKGSTITKGDLLITVPSFIKKLSILKEKKEQLQADSFDLKDQRSQRLRLYDTQLLVLRDKLAKAKESYENNKGLYDKKFISREELWTKENEVSSLETQISRLHVDSEEELFSFKDRISSLAIQTEEIERQIYETEGDCFFRSSQFGAIRDVRKKRMSGKDGFVIYFYVEVGDDNR